MYGRSRIAVAAAGLVAAAVLGAGLALAGAAAFVGFGGETVTRVVEGAGSGREEPTAEFSSPRAISINEIFRRAAPGVVQVTSTQVVDEEDPFGFPLPQREEQALGSGFVIDEAGHIVTNYHVVANARSVEVSFSNSENMKARVVGKDPSTDVAVLQVDARSRALTPLPLGDSDDVRVGDAVVAIGNPLGYERSVTAGIVSALQRTIVSPNEFAIDEVIQTDAQINRGNSGGPLLNARGEVIGVNSQIATAGSEGNIGIGFAVPINTVKNVTAQIIKSGRAEHAYLGISTIPINRELSSVFRLPADRGLLVQRVYPNSAAEKAGLREGTTQVVVSGETYMLGGDLIVTADGEALRSAEQLRELISGKKPGDEIELELYRGDDKINVNVKLGRQPASSPRG